MDYRLRGIRRPYCYVGGSDVIKIGGGLELHVVDLQLLRLLAEICINVYRVDVNPRRVQALDRRHQPAGRIRDRLLAVGDEHHALDRILGEFSEGEAQRLGYIRRAVVHTVLPYAHHRLTEGHEQLGLLTKGNKTHRRILRHGGNDVADKPVDLVEPLI